ncbi:MAG: DUF362 domain-containing protein [Eubacteriales bacterium]
MAIDVSIASCDKYDFIQCKQALLQIIQQIDGLSWVKPGMTIAVKANLVSQMKPELAATTHPTILCALTQILVERGASVVIGDSPGGLYTRPYVRAIYRATGMEDVTAYGADLNDDFSQVLADFPAGKVCKSFPYTGYLAKCDGIINVCKLKTHGMMGMSAAAKNLFGVIPGTVKPEYHFKYSNPADFARMLVDLNDYVNPNLSIVDGIVGMEGNGPTSGTPRQIGMVACAQIPHKLDLLCAALLGLDKSKVPTLEAAFERGYIPATVEQLEISGDWQSKIVADYETLDAQSSLLFTGMGDSLTHRVRGKFIQNVISPKPALRKSKCIGCKKCSDICPAKAIEMVNNIPKIKYKQCIHCFCCQEFCPVGAMEVRRSPLAKILQPL